MVVYSINQVYRKYQASWDLDRMSLHKACLVLAHTEKWGIPPHQGMFYNFQRQ